MPAGRPSKYNESALKVAKAMAKLGATDLEIAQELEVAMSTLSLWKVKHKEFSEALKLSKGVSDDRVERSLYERATGYSHEEDDIRVVNGEIVVTRTIKHYPPDATSMIFWLKNRRPDQWREKREPEGGEDLARAIEIIRATKAE